MLIEHTIKINTSQATVWQVATDVEQWPNWTPTVTSIHLIDGEPLRLGSTARIKQPGQLEAEWTVTEFVPNEYFVWKSRRLGITFIATHKIVSRESYSTSILQLQARGILPILLYPILKSAIGRALAEENKGLKKRCEEYSI